MSPLDYPSLNSKVELKKSGYWVTRIDLPNQGFPSQWETVLADLIAKFMLTLRINKLANSQHKMVKNHADTKN
jgi:hypothetical protein